MARPLVEAQTQRVLSHTGVVLCMQVRMHFGYDQRVLHCVECAKEEGGGVKRFQSLKIDYSRIGGFVRVNDEALWWFDKFSAILAVAARRSR